MSALFPEELETERLRLEQVCRDNVTVEELYAIRGSEEEMTSVQRYLPWEKHETPKETADLLDRAEREWEAGQAARYLIVPRANDDRIIAGYTKLEVDWNRKTGSLGIWLRKQFWGKGYAGERADSLLEIAFDQLDLEIVVASHHDGNEKSRRAIEKYVDHYGGRYEGLIRNGATTTDGPVDIHQYSISTGEYKSVTCDPSS